MAQTRGRRTSCLLHGGGVVREINQAEVADALKARGLPHEPHLAAEITTFLCDRLVSIDAAPTVTRGSEKEIERIEKAATELIAAMGAYSGMGDLALSIDDDLLSLSGQMGTDEHLYRWLVRLSKSRERYFVEHNPTHGYHRAIVRLRDLISKANGNVAIHRTSRFVSFLGYLETERPGMIFPPETVETGRVRYIERALKSCSPN